jgi:6-phosphogluconolactonase
MRTRFTWIVAILALAAVGFLMSCSTKYSSSNNGLVVSPSYGSLVMESFSVDLGNGHISEINNVNGPPTPGIPGAVILDPAGAYAYVATTINCTPQNPAANTSLSAVQGAIVAYPVASDGKLGAGTVNYLPGNPAYPSTFAACGLDDSTNPNGGNLPSGMAIDKSGKFLFVATSEETANYTTNTNTTPITTNATLNSLGVVVYSIGSNATLTQVTGSPFALPAQDGPTPNASALAVSSTVFPPQYSTCSLNTPPTTENLYVTDSVNNLVLNYSVNTSTGALAPVALLNGAPGMVTGTLPTGVAVDPCNRFVYVSNSTSNSVSAYTVCSTVSIPTNCQSADYSLQAVSGSPFAVSPGDGPGPLAVDAYGNSLYVVDTTSSEVSGFHISASNGGLTSAGTYPAGLNPNSIAVRSDDSFVFVANYNSSTISQYAITPSTGNLSPQSSFGTLNNPTGVAVK